MRLDLSDAQVKAVSEMTMGIGQGIFISTIIPFAFRIDNTPLEVIVLGWLGSGVCWLFSIQILK